MWKNNNNNNKGGDDVIIIVARTSRSRGEKMFSWGRSALPVVSPEGKGRAEGGGSETEIDNDDGGMEER